MPPCLYYGCFLSSGQLLPYQWATEGKGKALELFRQSISKRFTHPTENLQPWEEVPAIWYLLWNSVEIVWQVKKVPGTTDRPTDAPTERAIVQASFHLETRLKTGKRWNQATGNQAPPLQSAEIMLWKSTKSWGCNIWSSFLFYFSHYCLLVMTAKSFRVKTFTSEFTCEAPTAW